MSMIFQNTIKIAFPYFILGVEEGGGRTLSTAHPILLPGDAGPHSPPPFSPAISDKHS